MSLHGIIDRLLNDAPEISMPDNTKGKAIQCQITILGKTLAGALSHVIIDGERQLGVLKMLSIGAVANREGGKSEQVLVEIFVSTDAILSLDRVMPMPMIERPPTILMPVP